MIKMIRKSREDTIVSEKPSRVTFHSRMEYFVQKIERDIKIGKLEPNTFLPSLAKMAKKFQLSINSLQKGLDILEEDGLIERLPRKGIRIKDNHKYIQKRIRFGYYVHLTQTIYLEKLVAMFEQQHPNVKIELIPLQYENYKDVITHYFSTNMLDIVTITEINFHQLTVEEEKSHLFLPIEKDPDIYEYLYTAYQFDNRYYVTPFIFSPVILCYDPTYFSEDQLKELTQMQTWDEYNAFIKNVKVNNTLTYPFYFKVTANNRWPLFFLQANIDFNRLKDDDNYWPKDNILKALRMSYEVIHQNNLLSVQMLSDELNVEDLFKEGKIPMMLTSYYGLNDLRKSNIPYEIRQIPYAEKPATMLLSTGLAMNANIRVKKEAECFMNFLLSDEAQKYIRKETTVIPAKKQIATQKQIKPTVNQPDNYLLFENDAEEKVLLKDLNISQHERIQLLNLLKLYWMDLRDEAEMLVSIHDIYKNKKS